LPAELLVVNKTVAMNPSTAFATVLVDELIRCGLTDAVVAPGSRSAPLALALHSAASAQGSPLRLHVRIDERSASFLALGLAKTHGRPVVIVTTSGTAAAHCHAAVIEADEAGVPLLVLTADRPPELRGTGANQTIDQLKLYGSAVRWFCEAGVPENRPGQVAYWRSLACRAWFCAAGKGAAGNGTVDNGSGFPGPVHLNLPLREPLVPGLADTGLADTGAIGAAAWCEPLEGRPGGAAWTQFKGGPGDSQRGPALAALALDWTERGVVVAGDGAADPVGLAALAAQAGWPLLAEPSSGARQGPVALSSYPYLLDSPSFLHGHQPDLIISAGRPGLSRGQLTLLRGAGGDAGAGMRHVVLSQGPGRWSDPARTASEVAARVALREAPGQAGQSGWLQSWLAADVAARRAADEVLAADSSLSEPVLARAVAAALPAGGLLWAASSMPVRDLDRHMLARPDLRVLASRGASGIDGLVSAAIGAAIAHQASGGGPAVALLGDLALLHDAPGLMLGPLDQRPDLCLIVVNNDGGGIFSTLEQAAFPDAFERVFGTPHGADLSALAAAAGLPYTLLEQLGDLPGVLAGTGLRIAEVRTDRAAGAKLRTAIAEACVAAIAG
jgi:2-succinyl-5-enolpyruvyl-6-hydroxy-3-cyclohexene-1-carboxylate synthase